MTIYFLYGRRESLQGKSEAYKKSVRDYLESTGFCQTTDSAIQGTFQDMVFVNPLTDPGKKYLIEAKAEVVSIQSKKLARELVKYFFLSQTSELQGMRFKLFAQGVNRPTLWESIFAEKNDYIKVKEWCEWYNSKCLEENEVPLDDGKIHQIFEFFSKSDIIVGTVVDLQHAVLDNQSISGLSISKVAANLCNLVDRRREPLPIKSRLVLNILPITTPKVYYSFESALKDKLEIYDTLKSDLIPVPPFLLTREKQILTFADMEKDNPLFTLIKGNVQTLFTKTLQNRNAILSTELINVHLRRMFWNQGLYRDPKANILYFPMKDNSMDRIEVLDQRGIRRWVVKKIVQRTNSKYHKMGEINFYFHRGVEVRTPTYWGESFVELTPRRYYTLDGQKWVDGDIRGRIDRRFRNPNFDRSSARLGLMKFWRYILFEKPLIIPAEKWFSKFTFGAFLAETVNWSPKVIGRTQMRLWDHNGGVCNQNSAS
jgi:hypothetical protein